MKFKLHGFKNMGSLCSLHHFACLVTWSHFRVILPESCTLIGCSSHWLLWIFSLPEIHMSTSPWSCMFEVTADWTWTWFPSDRVGELQNIIDWKKKWLKKRTKEARKQNWISFSVCVSVACFHLKRHFKNQFVKWLSGSVIDQLQATTGLR